MCPQFLGMGRYHHLTFQPNILSPVPATLQQQGIDLQRLALLLILPYYLILLSYPIYSSRFALSRNLPPVSDHPPILPQSIVPSLRYHPCGRLLAKHSQPYFISTRSFSGTLQSPWSSPGAEGIYKMSQFSVDSLLISQYSRRQWLPFKTTASHHRLRFAQHALNSRSYTPHALPLAPYEPRTGRHGLPALP